ncbi:ribonuclease H-like domain-containing protein [Tanacetum coccineum]
MLPFRCVVLNFGGVTTLLSLAKRHEENSNIIKEIRASTDAAIRNQGASIKTLEIQIGQMSKVLQERGIGGLPGSTEPNPRDHVKSISTTKADSSEIRRMGCSPYAVSGSQHRSIFSETVPFPRRLQDYCCDDWREAQDVKILEAYDHTLPQKEKDPGSFTLPCFIHNVCFDKALVDLGASVSVMPFSTYTNLGLGILSHTRLTIELADRTIKQPRGIAENVLVRIGKFIFPIDFIILDIPEDDDVPLILGRPFLSTAHSKIDVYKRKITLRDAIRRPCCKEIDDMVNNLALSVRHPTYHETPPISISPPNYEWEQALDIDDSDLRLTHVIRPNNNPYILPDITNTTQTLFSSKNHQVHNCVVKPIRIIPGLAGIVQTTKLRKIADTREGREESVIMVEYVNVDGGIVTGCFGDVKKFLKNRKLEKLVAVIKSCTLNALGELTVTLNDLSSTIFGTIHYIVLTGDRFAKALTVGAIFDTS